MSMQAFYDRIAEEVVEPMMEFMRECGEDAAFSAEDVDRCKVILTNYLDSLAALTNPADDEIMEQVKTAVLALNALNEATDYALIETSEREAICILIQEAAEACGLQAEIDDVTEEWRDF